MSATTPASEAQHAHTSEFARYQRQMILPGFGVESQRRLLGTHAVLVGCGALGTVVADALARAGVGRLTIVDRDLVEFTNLQRQVLFEEQDARDALPKAEAAAARLGRINTQIAITPVIADINARNVARICDGADVVVDGTDNFQTRYLLNDVCVKHGWPLVYGGVVGTTGMTMTIVPSRERQLGADVGTTTPCLRCLFPEPPPPGSSPTCDTAGVLGPMAGVVASIQAAEALKVLLGRFDLLRASLGQFDIWNNHRSTIDLTAFDRTNCICCTHRRFEFLNAPAVETAALCGSDSVQILASSPTSINLAEFAKKMNRAGHSDFVATRFMVRGRVDDHALTLFADGRAIVKGTTDLARARSVYARYVGA